MADTNYEPKILTFKEQIVLDQVKKHYALTKGTFDTLERKAQTILSISSIAITIISGFRLMSPQPGQYPVLAFILLLYILTLLSAFTVLFPRGRASEPIPAKWDVIKKQLESADDDFYYNLLSGYEEACIYNAKVNSEKSRLVKFSFVFMSGIIVTALIMALGSI